MLRPDVERLANFPADPKFANDRFWGPATVRAESITGGFKMKWRQVGSGRVQLRLCVALFDDDAYLCRAYVKHDEKVDRREMARFELAIERIWEGGFTSRGQL